MKDGKVSEPRRRLAALLTVESSYDMFNGSAQKSSSNDIETEYVAIGPSHSLGQTNAQADVLDAILQRNLSHRKYKCTIPFAIL
jgi:hypothetical protein